MSMFFLIARALSVASMAAIVFAASALAAEEVAGEDEDPVVAIVNGAKIMKSETVDAASRLPAQFDQFPPEVRIRIVMRSLIDTKLTAHEARERGFHENPEYVARLAGIANQLLERMFMIDSITARLTEAALKEHYDSTVANLSPEIEVHARHILVNTEAEALEIVDELGNGADFAELAMARSIGPTSTTGGDLGYFTHSGMTPEFADAAFAMEIDQTSRRPIQTQFGWHVIHVIDRREAPPPSFEDLEASVREQLSQVIGAGIIDELRASATIEEFPDKLLAPAR